MESLVLFPVSKRIAAINKKVLKRLAPLATTHCYHQYMHTLEVVSTATELSKKEGLGKKDRELVQAAALYHDLGYIKQYKKNEPLAAALVYKELPKQGFNPKEVIIIADAVLATSIPQKPLTLIAKIVCDADLANLGEESFFQKGALLRMERAQLFGEVKSDLEWYTDLLHFMNVLTGPYYTATARQRFAKKKRENIRKVKKHLAIIKKGNVEAGKGPPTLMPTAI